jgi:hypothetical protein
MTPRSLRSLLFAFSLTLALAAPATALATDRYVDKQTGNDVGDCTNLATPCQSIGFAASVAVAGDKVRIDDSPTAYGESVDVTGLDVEDLELVGGDEGDVVIDAGGAFPALDVDSGTGTISGLTLRSSNGPSLTIGGGSPGVFDNVFDSAGAQVDIDINGGSPSIDQNVFMDSNTALRDIGITVDGASPEINNNEFTNLAEAINVGVSAATAPNVLIDGNEITGTHGTGLTNGYGIQVAKSSDVDIFDNVLTSGTPSSQTGISLSPGNNMDAPALEMRRNQIYGYVTGVFASDTITATLNGDVIGGSTDNGLFGFDDSAVGNGDITAKNVTVVGDPALGDTDIFVLDAHLTLDSSIVGDDGVFLGIGAGTCTITRSRGPVMVPGGSGCQNFQTTATPNFVNAAANDYALTANNAALIDDGDPAVPAPPNHIDYQAQKRNMDGDGDCSEIRDIGADEFRPAAPTASFTGGPDEGSTITTATTQFSFTNSYACPGATLECSFDNAAFSTCTSPATLGPLSNGTHTFSVRARDLVPQTGGAVTRTFSVNVPAPAAPAPPAKKKCKKGRKLKKGKCVKKKRKKKR